MRTITLNDHPQNIAVFNASSMEDAIEQGNAAYRQPHIHGVVWINAPAPNDWDAEQEVLKNVYSSPGTKALTIDLHASIENDGLNIIAADRLSVSAKAIGEHRSKNLLGLCKAFGKAKLQVRHEWTPPSARRHQDGVVKIAIERPHLPFKGHAVRILQGITEQSTIVYGPDDVKWNVGLGPALFFTGKEAGEDKALWHESPTFNFIGGRAKRIVDVYDIVL